MREVLEVMLHNLKWVETKVSPPELGRVYLGKNYNTADLLSDLRGLRSLAEEAISLASPLDEECKSGRGTDDREDKRHATKAS